MISLKVIISDAPIIVQSPVCAGIVETILEIKNPSSKHVILYFIFFTLYYSPLVSINIMKYYTSCSLKELIMYSNGSLITSLYLLGSNFSSFCIISSKSLILLKVGAIGTFSEL